MIKVTMRAMTWADMKQRLQEAADAITTEMKEHFPTTEELGYPKEAAPFPTAPLDQGPRFPIAQEAASQGLNPVAPQSAPSVDARGLPWDSRIHSSNKEITGKGVWQKKRGVDPNLVSQVENELIQKIKSGEINNDVTPTPVAPPSPFPTNVVPMQPPQPVAPTPPFPTAAPISPAPMPPSTSPAAAVAMPAPPSTTGTIGHTFESFQKQMIQTLANLTAAGKLTPDYMEELKKYFGVKELWAVSANQAREMFDTFVEFGWITKVG